MQLAIAVSLNRVFDMAGFHHLSLTIAIRGIHLPEIDLGGIPGVDVDTLASPRQIAGSFREDAA